jgi:hypothetical protein
MTPWSQPPQLSAVGAPLLTTGREATKRAATPALKVAPRTTTTATRLTGELRPVLGQKTTSRQATSGSVAMPTHATATAMHLPANAGLIFLRDKLTNGSIVLCNQNSSPSGPLLKRADGQPIPSWGFITKTVQFQGKLFTSSFLQATVAGPTLGIDFLSNSRSLLFQISTKYSLLALQRPRPPLICL